MSASLFASIGLLALGASAWVFVQSYGLYRDARADQRRTRIIAEALQEARALSEYGAHEEAHDTIRRALDETESRG